MKSSLRRMMRTKINEELSRSTPAYLPVGILQACIPDDVQTVFAFLSGKNEIDSAPLIQYALEQGKTVGVPKIAGNDLHFHQLSSLTDPIIKGTFGILEPSEEAPEIFPAVGKNSPLHFPLLILVPGLAFTPKGERLGKGGGYYDRFIARIISEFPAYRKRIILAGLCWSFQVIDTIPMESHDIKVDCLYTENGCILCTQGLKGIEED
jgi:5-formyltetrahydrofolate cyclo-ligase